MTVYEPAYNSSNDDVGVFYASLDDLMHRPPPVHPGHPGGQLVDDCRWTYTSISSSVVFRWESTGNDKRTDTRVVMIAFNFTSIGSLYVIYLFGRMNIEWLEVGSLVPNTG